MAGRGLVPAWLRLGACLLGLPLTDGMGERGCAARGAVVVASMLLLPPFASAQTSYSWVTQPWAADCPTGCGYAASTQARSVACEDGGGAAAPSASECNETQPASSRLCNATAACGFTGLCDACSDPDAAAGMCDNATALTAMAGILVHATTNAYDDVAAAYPNSASCTRQLHAPAGKRVRLAFTAFSTEATVDTLTIWDGAGGGSPALGTFSGGSIPANVSSSGNAVTLTFSSSDATDASGFQISWRFEDPIAGCRNASALNFDPLAEVDSGACQYATCSLATPPAHTTPGTCPLSGILAHGHTCELACEPSFALTSGIQPSCALSNDLPATGVLTMSVGCQRSGCMDSLGTNYDPAAAIDDGSCVYPDHYHCSGVVTSFLHGGAGTCALDGTLGHGQRCTLSCDATYAPQPPFVQPYCFKGELTSPFICQRAGCLDPWSENHDVNAVVNRACEYSCTQLSAMLKLTGNVPALSNPQCMFLEADRVPVNGEGDYTVLSQLSRIIHGVPAIDDSPDMPELNQRLVVQSQGSLVLRYIQLSNLQHAGEGGAVFATDALITVDRCRFTGASARQGWTYYDGGAIHADRSALHLRDSEFRDSNGADGGAIFVHDSTIKIESCTFVNNYAHDRSDRTGVGGAVYARVDDADATRTIAQWQFFDTIIIKDSSFSGNDVLNRTNAAPSVGNGGVLALVGIEKLRITNSRLTAPQEPFEGVATVITERCGLAGCRDVPDACSSGTVCIYANFSLWCPACAGSNQISEDGLSCQNCAAGRSPSADMTICEDCASGLASVHGICENCPPGKEPSVARNSCNACPAGKYSNDGQECKQCAVGTKPNLDLGAATSCFPCTSTHFSSQGLSCTRCQDGKHPNADASTCATCPSARAGLDGVCEQCPAGTTPNINSKFCLACPEGHVGINGLCVVCGDGYTADANRVDCYKCPAGFAGTGGECAQCRDGEQSNMTHCAQCPPGRAGVGGECGACNTGQQPTADATSCVSCPPGWAGTDGSCSKCAAGFQPTVDRSSCDACSTGYVSTDGVACFMCGAAQQVRASSNRSACEACSLTHISVNGVCKRCESGKTPNQLQSQCNACAAGFAGVDGGCRDCGVGYEPTDNATTCSACQFGAYKGINMTECVMCEDGERVLNNWCSACPAGMAGTGGHCSQCQSGKSPSGDDVSADSVKHLLRLTDEEISVLVLAFNLSSDGDRITLAKHIQRHMAQVAAVNAAAAAAANETNGSNDTNATSGLGAVVQQQQQDDIVGVCSDGISSESSCEVGYCLTSDYDAGIFQCEDDDSAVAPLSADNCLQAYYILSVYGLSCSSDLRPAGINLMDESVSGDGSLGSVCPQQCDSCPTTQPFPLSYNGQPLDLSNRVDCIRANGQCNGAVTFPPGLDTPMYCSTKISTTWVPPRRWISNPGATSCDNCPNGTVGIDGLCYRCKAGYQPNKDLTSCDKCGAGMVSEGDVCVTCPEGQGVMPLSNISSCDPCPTGHVGVHGVCISCRSGEEPSNTGGHCIPCNATAAGVDGVCIECKPAFEASLDSTKCVACLAGKYRDSNMTRCKFCSSGQLVVDGTSCAECPLGQAGVAGQCTTCPSGHQPSSPLADACEPCPPGYAGYAGTCQRCDAGSQPSLGRVQCELCPEGKFSGEGVQCVTCPTGHGVAPGSARMACQNCSIEEISVLGVCTVCPNGFEPNAHQSQCNACPTGAAGMSGVCTRCQPGHEPFDGSTSCRECPAGRFKDEPMHSCRMCEDGKQVVGSRTACSPCPAGYAGIDGKCSKCASGRLPVSDSGSDLFTACDNCPIGRAGTDGICVPCLPGSQPNSMRTTCVICAAGFASSNGTECLRCSPGSGVDPSSNRALCAACVTGHAGTDGICYQCDNGYEPALPLRDSCVPCAVGFAGLNGVCEECGTGLQPNEGSSACEPLGCLPGWRLNETTTACEPCPDGTEVRGGKFCLPCQPRFGGVGGFCRKCPSSKSPSQEYPIELSSGSWDVTGATNTTLNATHTNISSPPHPGDGLFYSCQFCQSGTAGVDGECLRCQPGTQPSQELTYCEACATGKISDNGTVCVHCGVGQQVDPLSGNTRCEACPLRHIGIDGICHQCENGKQPDSDQGTCRGCDADTAGQGGECLKCPQGMTPGFGSTVCILCDAGLFKPPNASSCTDCWKDSTSTADRSSCECNIGFETSSSGNECQDVNECVLDNGGCDMLSQCINTVPGRRCGSCPSGYVRVYSPDYSATYGYGSTQCIPLVVSFATEPTESIAKGNVSEEGAPQTKGDVIEPLTPELGLTLNASVSPEVLVESSPARSKFIRNFREELAASLGIASDLIVVTSIDPVQRRRRSLSELSTDLQVKMSFIFKTPQANEIIRDLQNQLADPTSSLANSTISVASRDLNLKMVCGPGLVPFDNVCTSCSAGRYLIEDSMKQRACQNCPMGTYKTDGVALTCSRCAPGNQPRGLVGAIECQSCSEFGSTMHSADGQTCTQCPTFQVATVQDTGCQCAENTFNSSLVPTGISCVHSNRSATKTRLNGSTCESCGLANCVECGSGGIPVPRQGFWGKSDRHLYQCRLETACIGGFGTHCANGHAGVTCATCSVDFVRKYDGQCASCTDEGSWGLVSSFTVFWVVAWTLYIVTPRRQSFAQALGHERRGTNSRVLLSFLQTQSLISHFAVQWTAPASTVLTFQTVLSDMAAPFTLNQCTLQTSSSFEFTRAAWILWSIPLCTLWGCGTAFLFRSQQYTRKYKENVQPSNTLKKLVRKKVLGAIKLKLSFKPKVTREEKIESIFNRFDDDQDGILHHDDIAHLAAELEDDEYDDQAYLDLCDAVGVQNPRRGLKLHDFAKQFHLSGSGDDEALDEAYKKLFPDIDAEEDDSIHLGGDPSAVSQTTKLAPPQTSKFQSMAALLLYIAYPSLVFHAVAVLSCENLDEHIAVLSANPGVECHDEAHKSATKMTFPPLVVFGFGLPLVYAILSRRKNLWQPMFPLGSGLRWPQWELVVTGRKVAMVLIAILLRPQGGIAQAFAGLTVIQVALLLQWSCEPILDTAASRLESAGLAVSFATLLAAVTTVLPSNDSHSEYSATTTSTSPAILSAGLICAAANVAVVVVGLRMSFRMPRQIRRLEGACLRLWLSSKAPLSATPFSSQIAPKSVTQESETDRQLIKYLDDADTALSRDELRHAKGQLNAAQQLLIEQEGEDAPPALRLLESLRQQVQKAGVEAPELASELEIIAAQLARVRQIGSAYERVADGMQRDWDGEGSVPGAARRYLRKVEDDSNLHPMLKEKAAPKSKTSAKHRSPLRQKEEPRAPPPAWLAGCDLAGRAEKLRAMFDSFEGVKKRRGAGSTMEPEILQHVLGRLGFRCSVEEAAATIESIVCGALTSAHLEMISQGDMDRPPIRFTFDDFELAVTSVADQPSMATAASDSAAEADVDSFLADESEPDWTSTFVVGKYLAALVEATPEVQARRAAEAAVENARKNGQVDQALAISPFWAMRPHELRALAENLDTPAATKAREERPLKSDLVRLLVESEIYTKARAASHKAGGTGVPTRTLPPRKTQPERPQPQEPMAAQRESADTESAEEGSEGKGLVGWLKKRPKWFGGGDGDTGEKPVAVGETKDLRKGQLSTRAQAKGGLRSTVPMSKYDTTHGPRSRTTLEAARATVGSGQRRASVSTSSSFAQRAISKVGKPQHFNDVLR